MLFRIIIFLLATLAFVIFDQDPGFSRVSLTYALRAWVCASVFFALCMGIGAAALKRFGPDACPDWDLSLGLGLALWGGLSFLAAAFGAMGLLTTVAVVAIMASVSFFHRDLSRPSGPVIGWAVIGVLGLFTLVDALGPTIDTDAVYFHVSLPKQIWLAGELIGGPLHPNGSRPMLLHAPFAMLYGVGGETAPAVFSWFVSMALLGSVLQRAEKSQAKAGLWAIALLLSSWSFLNEMGIAANNLSAAYFVWICWVAIREQRYTIAGILAGAALSVKYTSFGPIVALWLFVVPGWRNKLKTATIGMLMVSVWWVWNLLNGLHPMFPYAGWALDFPFQHLDKYGMGRGALDLLMLPINASLHAEIDSFRFLGQLHPLWLLSIPLALKWEFRSPGLGWVVLTSVIFWGAGPHWLRHLLPAAPLIALWLGMGLSRLNRFGVGLAGLVFAWGLPANLGPMIAHWGERSSPTFFEDEARLHRYEKVPSWRAAEWANQRLPPQSKCALFYTWPGLAFDRPYVLGSVEDHVPSRHFLLLHEAEFVDVLRTEGVDHLVVGPNAIARHLYPFLSDAEFDAQYKKPAQILEDGLLRHGELIFEAASHRVYRIRK